MNLLMSIAKLYSCLPNHRAQLTLWNVHEFGWWFWNLKRQAILVWHRCWIFLWNQANLVIVRLISYFCNVNYCCTHWVTHCHTHLAKIVFSKHNFICVSCTHGIQLSLLFTSIKGIGCEAHPIEREYWPWSMKYEPY